MENISLEQMLAYFIRGSFIDETCFCFASDPQEIEHYIGYHPEQEFPYWAGLCDIPNGCEFAAAEDLFEAPIYGGRSLKERWEEVVLVSVEGLHVEEWKESVPLLNCIEK